MRAHKRGREELPHVRGQGQKPRGPHARGAAAKAATSRLRSGVVAERSYPVSEVGGSGREGLPRIQDQGWRPRMPGCDRSGAAGRSYPWPKALGGWLGGANPGPRTSGCAGAGGLRGATPRSRSGGATVRRYPSSKVRGTQVRQ